jgi:hypothetical protein
LLGTLFELRDLGAVKLRGVAASVPAWRVLRPAAVDSRFEAFRGSAPLSPLIGREDDLAVLLRRWERAWGGQGQLVLLSGEPGIGKSRLIAALLDAVGAAPHTRLRYFCAPHHSESPLHPFIAQLERAAGFERGDRPLARLEKLDALLSVTGTPPEDRGLIAELLSLPVGGRYPSLDLTPQRRRRRLLEALLAQLSALAATQPVLAVVEDVHWADPSSRELLDQVVAHLRDQRLLLIVTFRPEFAPPWIGQQQVTSLTLSRLNRKDSETLAGVTADGVLRRGLLETIVVQADGVPLFIEELTKAVLETSADHSAAAIPASVPATLHASLMARLDRLPAAREVAQIGAVIGREFPHTLLAATDLMPAAELTRGLEELIASGLAVRRGMLPDAIYTFNHALTRDVAYTSMLRRRRQTCHQRIAVVLEEFDDGFIRATEPELLAYHFQEAEEFSAALEYWIAAGDAAEQRGANQEAAAHYGAARQLIERAVLPASDRARLPELLMKLGNAQVQEAGYNSEDVMRIYQEARDAALALDQQDEAAEARHPDTVRRMRGGWAALARLPYRHLICLDTEFRTKGDPHRGWCLCGVELRSGQEFKLWLDGTVVLPPFPLDESTLFIAFVAGAEVATIRALGWPMPARIFDLFQEFRIVTNTGRRSDPRGLEAACAHFGIAMMDHAAKKHMQNEAQERTIWLAELRRELTGYCFEDGLATARLFLCVWAEWLEIHAGDEERALHHALRRGRFAGVMAEAELRGIRFNPHEWAILRDGRESVFEVMVNELAPELRPIYRDGKEGPECDLVAFASTMESLGLAPSWPRTGTGLLNTTKDVLRAMLSGTPELEYLAEVMKVRSRFALLQYEVGADGRARCPFFPGSTATGRNIPKATKFIFNAPAMFRHLIEAPPGMVVISLDYRAEESGLVGGLAGDAAMMDIYNADEDVHLGCAKRCGLVPPEATQRAIRASARHSKRATSAWSMAPRCHASPRSWAWGLDKPSISTIFIRRRFPPYTSSAIGSSPARGLPDLRCCRMAGARLCHRRSNPRRRRISRYKAPRPACCVGPYSAAMTQDCR